MALVFIRGSTGGLGRAGAQSLLDQGHGVVLHARSADRAGALGVLASRRSALWSGTSRASPRRGASRTRSTRSGAWIPSSTMRASTRSEPGVRRRGEGHAGVLAVNALAPYLLTALMDRPGRLVYLSSGLHQSGRWTRYPGLADASIGFSDSSPKSCEWMRRQVARLKSGSRTDYRRSTL
jgi:NAD(P)-dependent dehydrogenase (short-subunit alcohol dehydrogenase family)